jgi:glycosyltransferase involved in cell wall biosynthesis
VLRAHTPVTEPGFHDAQMPWLQRLFAGQFASRNFCDHGVAWFHTPMALPLLRHLRPSVVVYDYMDDLASFKAAPPALRNRERTLMRLADVVFTGGLSLYRARLGKHTTCIGSRAASTPLTSLPRSGEALHVALAAIPGPRLGYIGVIDERLDLRLLAHMADARPDWQVVLVGPVATDATDIPVRPNIHRLPQQQYADLPALLAGFDVALMPFAINEATRSISPTKTLEYVAAGRPVVSTPVRDVVDSYAGIVQIAADADAFVAAGERVLGEKGPARAARQASMAQAVAATSWDATVAAMHDEIEKVQRRRRHTTLRAGTLGTVAPPAATASASATS